MIQPMVNKVHKTNTIKNSKQASDNNLHVLYVVQIKLYLCMQLLMQRLRKIRTLLLHFFVFSSYTSSSSVYKSVSLRDLGSDQVLWIGLWAAERRSLMLSNNKDSRPRPDTITLRRLGRRSSNGERRWTPYLII